MEDISKIQTEMYTITLDDDPMVHRLISKILEIESKSFLTAKELMDQVENLNPMAAFIDVSLGGNECGLDVVPTLKSMWPKAPIIVITNTPAGEGVAEALATGADDFLKKPFTKSELTARFSTRRKQLLRLAENELIEFGDLSLNTICRELNGPSGKHYLSPTEVSILKCLIEADGNLVQRDSLKRKCWGNIVVTNNALDRHIHGVRNAIKNVTQGVKMRSVYGKGYIIENLVAMPTKMAS